MTRTMGGHKLATILLLLMLVSASAVMGYRRGREWEEERGEEEREEEEEEEEFPSPHGGRGRRRGKFMLEEPEVVVRTESGIVRVARGYRWKGLPSTVHIGFIDMDPNSLFLPQYMDASLILFIRRGEARVGRIYKDGMVERDLKMGDIYMIPAGFAFYIENIGRGQSLQIITSIDTSESQGPTPFQSFFIGGGTYPTSVLSGFDMNTLTTALNVSDEEVDKLLSRQSGGPIVRVVGDIGDVPEKSKRLAKIMAMKQTEMRRHHQFAAEDEDEDEEMGVEPSRDGWTLKRLVNLILGIDENENDRRKEKTKRRKGAGGGGPEPYNLYDKKPDFQNTYGWTVALDESDYKPLKSSGLGVYLVNLTAGSMLAPHLNPTATEYGIVIGGTGSIQVVFPNGSLAMNAELEVGDSFWIPRYFPFCQIASRSGSLEFFGFTTSARRNRPQFLVGASSVLASMNGPELAAAFDMSEERLDELIRAQDESIILPSWPRERRGRTGEGEEERRRGRGEEEQEREEEEGYEHGDAVLKKRVGAV